MQGVGEAFNLGGRVTCRQADSQPGASWGDGRSPDGGDGQTLLMKTLGGEEGGRVRALVNGMNRARWGRGVRGSEQLDVFLKGIPEGLTLCRADDVQGGEGGPCGGVR